MGFLAQVIDDGSSTSAGSRTSPVIAAVSAGDTVVVWIMTIGSGANISSVADSEGNTWTLISHNNNSASGNDQACYRSTLANAWTTSSTFTTTVSGSNFSSITVVAASMSGAMVHEGAPTYVSSNSNSAEDTSVASSAAGTLLGWMGHFMSSATAVSVSGTGWAAAGTFATATSNSAVAVYKDVAGATSSTSVTVTWTPNAAHGGYAIGFSMVAASAPTTDISGIKGAASSFGARFGHLTTTPATVLALNGKKTAGSSFDARFGEFTAEYLNFGGAAWFGSRFGTLDLAAATTPITGIKGAALTFDSRFGALTTNTHGNLRIDGKKTAGVTWDSRFGKLSLVGLVLEGAQDGGVTFDSRFGYLLLHNRTPGVVTVRAENKGLVTIRIGS